MNRDLEFIYVGDVMCSWCWGFAPVVERIERDFAVPLAVTVGGLRPGPAATALDEGAKATIGHHWDQVEAASGQPFDRALFERHGWVYDTEQAAIAVVTMRELDQTLTLPWFTRLQRAFYAEGVDVTDAAVYPDLLAGFAVDSDRFVEMLASEEMKTAAWRDFALARSLSVNGFPTLLFRDGDERWVVTRGYAPADRLLPALAGWMTGRYGTDAAREITAVDA